MEEIRYPLGEYEAERISSKTGKKLSEITLEEIRRGHVTGDDIKISKETLRRQGEVAKSADNLAMTHNFERASELVDVPDETILKMYNMLRPNRSTKEELLAMADVLERQYHATHCARLVRDAADVYEKRGILR